MPNYRFSAITFYTNLPKIWQNMNSIQNREKHGFFMKQFFFIEIRNMNYEINDQKSEKRMLKLHKVNQKNLPKNNRIKTKNLPKTEKEDEEEEKEEEEEEEKEEEEGENLEKGSGDGASKNYRHREAVRCSKSAASMEN
ncbi:unnamed protein product [Cuscuta epithymum]|uniref:Translocon at the inner envelope membrane of chloroplasts 214 n=1 Tax=Cuscuta epithymum TaxID=186058 RepID=A0AAV0G197_9ASTE|nr:unnamed protein product [Cuscuta epithymum]